MKTKLFDGKVVARTIENTVRDQVLKLDQKTKLVWISLGGAAENKLYGDVKGRAAERIGIEFESWIQDEDWEMNEVIHQIEKFNQDDQVNGIMVQLPVLRNGERITARELGTILNTIRPAKDVDCLTAENLGRIIQGDPLFLPATVASVMEVLFTVENNLDWLVGKRVVVVGGGLEIGRPLVSHLSNLGASVLWSRSSEVDLAAMTGQGDVVVSATGQPNLLTIDMLKDGAVLVDVGSPRGDFSLNVIEKARFVTPVPGGVGPVTVVSLMRNVVNAAKLV